VFDSKQGAIVNKRKAMFSTVYDQVHDDHPRTKTTVTLMFLSRQHISSSYSPRSEQIKTIKIKMFLVRQIEKIYKYRYKNKYIFYIILKQIYVFLNRRYRIDMSLKIIFIIIFIFIFKNIIIKNS